MSVPPPNHHCPGMPFHSCMHPGLLLPFLPEMARRQQAIDRRPCMHPVSLLPCLLSMIAIVIDNEAT